MTPFRSASFALVVALLVPGSLPLAADVAPATRYRASDSVSPVRLIAMPSGEVAVLGGYLLFKVDGSGAVVASRGLGDSGDFGAPTAATLVVGRIQPPYPVEDPWRLRLQSLDAKLQPRWAKAYDLPGPMVPHIDDIQGTPDGGVVLAGALGNDALLMRFDAEGAPKWGIVLEASGEEALHAVRALRSGGFVAAGVNSAGAWLVKLTGSGAIEWQKTFSGNQAFFAVAESKDGNIVAAGARFNKALFAAVDAKGEQVWQRTASMTGRITSLDVDAAGMITALGRIDRAPVVLRLKSDGVLQWARRSTRPLPKSMAAQPNGMAVAGAAIVIAPPAEAFAEELDLVRIETASGASPCAWIQPADEKLQNETIATESLAVDLRPIELRAVEAMWPGRDAKVAAEPVACEAAAAVKEDVPASSFRGAAEGVKRRAAYGELFASRDIKALEAVAQRVAKQKEWPSTLLSPLMDFHLGIGDAGVDDATRIAILGDWIREYPQSVTARVELASALYDAAWRRRGGGYSSTVTDKGHEEYVDLMKQAARALADAGPAADADPLAWRLRIEVAHESGEGDVVALAERAVKFSTDQRIFSTAAHYLHPRWGGSPEEYRAFAEKVAEWTKETHGSGMYAWLAYEAYFSRQDVPYEAYGFDWERTKRGFRELTNIRPEWLPLWHCFARLAVNLQERVVARELFSRPELAWYESAESVWRSKAAWTGAREWALRRPVESFVDSAPSSRAASGQPPIAPPVTPPSAPPAPSERPSASRMRPPSKPAVGAAVDGQWPQIVMQNEIVLASGRHQQMSFFVETAGGIVAVSAVPAENVTEGTWPIRTVARDLKKWTMWSPREPKQVFEVASFETKNASSWQTAVALTLKPFAGTLPVHVLKAAVRGGPPSLGRHWVVVCRWEKGTCRQTVLEALVLAASGAGLSLGVRQPPDGTTLRGAPVLNEDGYAVAVASGYTATATPEWPLRFEAVNVHLALGAPPE